MLRSAFDVPQWPPAPPPISTGLTFIELAAAPISLLPTSHGWTTAPHAATAEDLLLRSFWPSGKRAVCSLTLSAPALKRYYPRFSIRAAVPSQLNQF